MPSVETFRATQVSDRTYARAPKSPGLSQRTTMTWVTRLTPTAKARLTSRSEPPRTCPISCSDESDASNCALTCVYCGLPPAIAGGFWPALKGAIVLPGPSPLSYCCHPRSTPGTVLLGSAVGGPHTRWGTDRDHRANHGYSNWT
ncbi:MAG: hypothetical protein LC798_18920 [Chloroflexi bacterium]|nr:hypothetical protein [Chloroflexota bacterium]